MGLDVLAFEQLYSHGAQTETFDVLYGIAVWTIIFHWTESYNYLCPHGKNNVTTVTQLFG